MTLPSAVNPATDLPDADIHEPLPQQEQFYRAPVRFGSIPVDSHPKGYDQRERFYKLYPRIDLPTQIVERVALGKNEAHEPNRLIWGDNLHVMRQIPNNSIDLIYIDPPFFSGRQYNVIWGDNNELRSFLDIWEGGMEGYLIWLNARLYEMKRLLKSAGSIYVHCDYHASHYIKVEMDKIFGYHNFRNEVIWCYGGRGMSKRSFQRKHDVLLFYSLNGSYFFDPDGASRPVAPEHVGRYNKTDDAGKQYAVVKNRDGSYSNIYLKDVVREDWWDIPYARGKETIGYPTQKPESLIERIIKASSKEGDVIADFFVGGGTTAAVAQRLNRRFIAADQSRVAVSVTAERLKQAALTRGLDDTPFPDFTIEQWGIYEAERLAAMPAGQFRDFVLQSYGATRMGQGDEPDLHGWRNQLPIWVGAPELDSQATAAEVRDFANAIRRTEQYQQANLRDGVMLAWGFRPDAAAAADQLREQENIAVNFVRLKQVRIGDADFREHIIGRSTNKADYSEFLTFIQPPVVNVSYLTLGGSSATFDARDTAVINSGAEISNVQWDFDYDGRRFNATPGYSFQREGSAGKKKPVMVATHRFPRPGRHRVACRVQDSRGGEGFWDDVVEVN